MNKLVTTAMVAVLGLFGAIEDGRVTLVSSASAAPTGAQLSAVRTALRSRLTAINAAKATNNQAALAAATQALERYLAATPVAASLVADVLATLPPQVQANIAASVGTAMGKAQETLIANGSPASLQAAASLAQEVQQTPPAVQQAAVGSFQNAGGNTAYSAPTQIGGGSSGGAQQAPAAQQLPTSSSGSGGSASPN